MKHERIKPACTTKQENLPDPALGLVRELRGFLGEDTAVHLSRERSWASATFAGVRLFFDATLSCPNAHARAAHVKAEIVTHEFTMSGHFVAEISVQDIQYSNDTNGEPITKMRIEALTIEDR